ncbi:hypothetical protein [Emticicia sp. SJ17W-69]|uniref:hypothetical protein n=1 Tax=Emticicia sp. SJ17W-69 TaxID=3421657 RepID=UPI003EB9297F
MIPKKIKILRIEDYHTHYIGKFDSGKQFFGYEHFVSKPSPNEIDWQKNRHEYVVLYLFDENGSLESFKYWYAGTTAELNCDTNKKLDELVKSLGKVRFCNIKVAPSHIEIDGIIFGLIPKIDDDYERIELDPSSTIAFSEPWDGEYDT